MGGEERELAALYLRRAQADFDDLARAGFLLAGNGFPRVLLLKGEPGPAELAGGALLSGPDGAALGAALSRLGYADDGWAACSAFLRTDSADADARVLEAGGFCRADPADLSWAIEVFDPELVIALDSEVARALVEAWELDEPFSPGTVTRVRGRRVLVLDGFEASLADSKAKQLSWACLKQVPPLRAPL